MFNKRSISIILTLIISFLVIGIYSIFNGIPFGSIIAKAKITEYVREVYDLNENIPAPRFNSKESSYRVYLSHLDSEISYDLSQNQILDEKLVHVIDVKFQDQYNKLRTL
ncbi:hypothetical protein FZC79_22460 [Rossellomorea vietnamensis]|uniref:YfjL-like N-terminal domain-containing protein n=1 Tax=Rossellomorea vietnamensis TaxID=218284 RepID=A0A5D4K905_9BACI|nr:hypothetical protein [Rossellomorea vietnamensis]TYR72543.1 hypothetical protein FZC79_22460 [Rossellomorea vietnamensis]